jgi:hypothetical protein
VQLGDRYTAGCKLGISNIHTQNQRRKRRCHVSAPHWSTSPMWVPLMPCGNTLLVHLTQPMSRGRILFNPVRSPSATWQSPIGPPQPCGPHHYIDLTCGPHLCHVSAYDGATSALICHMAAHQGIHLSKYNPVQLHLFDTWQLSIGQSQHSGPHLVPCGIHRSRHNQQQLMTNHSLIIHLTLSQHAMSA